MKRIIEYMSIPAMLLATGMFYMSCSDMEKEFQSKLVEYPAITLEGFSPQSALPGAEVTITGTNFGEHSEAAKIYFNGVEAPSILSYTDTEIVVNAPEDAGSGRIAVQVWTHTDTLDTDFTFLPAPRITSILPEQGAPGDQVILNGQNFGMVSDGLQVFFRDDVEAEIVSIEDDKIVVIVPDGGRTGVVSLKVGEWSRQGPVFTYPLVGLNAQFETGGDSEGWVPQQNATYEVSGGKLNVTFDPGQFGGTSKRRADLKLEGGTEIHAGAFPIVAIKFDKPEAANVIFDTNLGSYGNGRNNWTGVLHGDVYYYDLSQKGFGGNNTMLSTSEATQFTTFQFKIADITSDETGYSVDWIQSFESIEDLKAAAALPEGQYIFEFNDSNSDDWRPSQNAGFEIVGGKLNVTYDAAQFEGTNKRRADLYYIIGGNYPHPNGSPKDHWVYTSEYPIVAFKIHNLPAQGNVRPDIRGASFGNNDYKKDFVEQDVIYWDLSEKFTDPRVELDLFQVKIADITSDETGYEVDWIRTFKSVDELSGFINK